MTASPIHTQLLLVDGLRIRFAESAQNGEPALLLNPWPESLYAYEPTWAALARDHHLIAVDLPGFGLSEGRADLFTPRAMGDFVVRILDVLGLDRAHLVGPDVGTSAALFAAATHPGRFASLVVGTGAASVPLELGEPLAGWIAAPDAEVLGPQSRQLMEATLANIHAASPLPERIRADYLASYEGHRFVESLAYLRSYPVELPVLGRLLPTVRTPVRIVTGGRDTVIPPSNAEFLNNRLPDSKLDVVDTGHFVWEQDPDTYAGLVLDWWAEHPIG